MQAAPPTPTTPAAVAASEPPRPEPQRLPVREDVADRLADKLPEIEFREVPLVQALRILSELSTLSVTLDLDALADSKFDVESRVSIKMKDATVADILTAVLAPHRLIFFVDEGQVLATTPQQRQETRKTEQYPVADLTGLEPQAVSHLIRQVVAPSSWHQGGGLGTVQVSGANLVVEQSSTVHRQLRSLFDRLRIMRGKTVPTAIVGQSDPTSRFAAARNKLAYTFSANFHEETSLMRILEYLEKTAGLRFVVDMPALAQEGIAPDALFSLTADRHSLSDALVALLQPHGLTYRIYNDATLQITSLRAARQRLDVEVYKVTDLVAPALPVDALADRIKAQVSLGTWRETGGPGLIVVDASVPCLIVLQTQAAQLQLQESLDRSRAARRETRP
jgi:hypothetical protein